MNMFNGPQDYSVMLDGKHVQASEMIKTLGVKRLIKIINGVKIIRKKFETKQMKKVITAQAFTIPYYYDVVQLNPSAPHENYKKLNRIHYAALRLMVGDRKKRMLKKDIDNITERLPPGLGMPHVPTPSR